MLNPDTLAYECYADCDEYECYADCDECRDECDDLQCCEPVGERWVLCREPVGEPWILWTTRSDVCVHSGPCLSFPVSAFSSRCLVQQ